MKYQDGKQLQNTLVHVTIFQGAMLVSHNCLLYTEMLEQSFDWQKL